MRFETTSWSFTTSPELIGCGVAVPAFDWLGRDPATQVLEQSFGPLGNNRRSGVPERVSVQHQSPMKERSGTEQRDLTVTYWCSGI